MTLKNFIKIFKKSTVVPSSFIVNDITLPSGNLQYFTKNVLEWIQKLIITIDDRISDEKLQCDINKEPAKISALLSGKIDKYEYLTGEEILYSNRKQIKEQGKFAYSLLGKAFKEQTETIKDQGDKQVDNLKSLQFSEKQLPLIKDFISKAGA